jgi:hypothetical protein
MSFPFRTELVAENTILGTQQAVWKERLRGKPVLEENIQIVAVTTGGGQRLFALYLYPSNIPNEKRVGEFCYYVL